MQARALVFSSLPLFSDRCTCRGNPKKSNFAKIGGRSYFGNEERLILMQRKYTCLGLAQAWTYQFDIKT